MTPLGSTDVICAEPLMIPPGNCEEPLIIPLGNCDDPLIIPLGTFVKSVYEETPLPPAASDADVNIPPPIVTGKHKGGNVAGGGRNSKNRLIMDIVQQYGLERKYGIGAKNIQKNYQ